MIRCAAFSCSCCVSLVEDFCASMGDGDVGGPSVVVGPEGPGTEISVLDAGTEPWAERSTDSGMAGAAGALKAGLARAESSTERSVVLQGSFGAAPPDATPTVLLCCTGTTETWAAMGV